MNKISSVASRPTGPQKGQCAKRVSILDAAADVFCREGFGGASIDEIAAEACVSRQTVYNHYHDKETLFMAVVDDVMSRANAMLFAILAAFSMRLSKNCICNQDGKFLRRLVQIEGERYPQLFESWRQQGPLKITGALAALLARLNHAGGLQIDDCDLAARQFLALGSADLQMLTLLGETPSDAQLDSAARNAVRTFLRAYGPPSLPATMPLAAVGG